MSQITRLSIPFVTSAGGAFSGFSPNFSGRILGAHVIVPGSGGIASATIALTSEATGEAILSLSSISATTLRYPRTAIHDTSGAGALYASGGTALREPIALGDDRVAIAVSGGGNAKAATIILIVEGD